MGALGGGFLRFVFQPDVEGDVMVAYVAMPLGTPTADTEEAVEQIDIGGPAMIRAAAKNHRDVAVVVDPADYETVLGEIRSGGVREATAAALAVKAYARTAQYDATISAWLGDHPPAAE